MKVKACVNLAIGVFAFGALGGCASMSDKTTMTEYFRVYDIKTTATPTTIAKAATKGIGKDINNINGAFPINTSGVIPTKASHMTLVDPFSHSSLGSLSAFAEGAGTTGLKIARCDGAAWTAKSVRNDDGNFGQTFDFCLFPYKGGYQFDMYGNLVSHSGGFGAFSLGRAMARSVVGSPKKYMEKAFTDTLTAIHDALPSAKISYLRGTPTPSALPWKETASVK